MAVTVPEAVRADHAGWRWTRVWENENGTITHRVESADGVVRFVKVAPSSAEPALLEEARRMEWAAAHLPVPRVIGSGVEADGSSWLVTSALRGIDPTREPLIRQPARVVPILARGLRRFHEAAPVASCPFSFRLDDALAIARTRVGAGRVVPERHFHPQHRHLSAERALAILEETRPETEDLVVSHGDSCFPNALIEDEEVSGFVDLGHLAVADRWWDIAVGSWSTTWNVGPGWEQTFYAAYGIAPDPERIAFYRLLREVTM